MSSTNRTFTDAHLRAALATRATRTSSPHELMTEVVAAIQTMQQRRGWISTAAHPNRPALVFAGLAVLASALVAGGLIGGRFIQDTTGGTIAYAQGRIAWDGGPQVLDPAILGISAAGGDGSMLASVSAFLQPPQSSYPLVRTEPAVRWSPDGARIAFRLNADEPGLYVMNRDGTELRRVAEAVAETTLGKEDGFISSFAWSPDGERIAFISPLLEPWPPITSRNGRLYVVDVASGELREVAEAANGSVAWSPDGSSLAFGRTQPHRSVVVIVDADGHSEQVYQPSVNGNSHPGGITWSPDGSLIAFQQTRFGGDREGESVVVVDADGSNAREIAYAGLRGCCLHGAFGGLIEWSPDGALIAEARGDEIAVIVANGSGRMLSVAGMTFDWSPNGSQLVVAAPGPTLRSAPLYTDDPATDPRQAPRNYRSTSIFIVDADGDNRRWLADGDYPAWSP